MSGPPEDVPADELWQKLLERPRPSEVVDWVRKSPDGAPLGKIRIQVLTLEQHNLARLQARKYIAKQGIDTKEIGADEALQQVIGDATACELLAMACVHENPLPGTEDSRHPGYALAFPGDNSGKTGADQLRENLTADELATLFNYYLLIQEKYGPSERSIQSDEELTAWIDRLVEGASALPLARQNSYQRVELITSLAARCYCLSGILASLWSSLPQSSKSVLETLGIGPGSATEPPSSSTTTGSSPSEKTDPLPKEQADAVDEALIAMSRNGEPIDLDDARALVEQMRRYR